MYIESYKIKYLKMIEMHTHQRRINNMLEIKYRYIFYGQEIRGKIFATSKKEGIKIIKQRSPRPRHGLMIKVVDSFLGDK